MQKNSLLFIFFLFGASHVFGQSQATLQGKITDKSGNEIPGVNVRLVEYPSTGASSSLTGEYSFNVPANETLSIAFTFIGYRSDTIQIELQEGEKRTLNVILSLGTVNLGMIEIEDKVIRETPSSLNIEVKDIDNIPTPFGGIEAAIVTQGLGVSSTNELSSTYSVRGGNFDENLVYVNDFEIFRPFLIRSGQQEGLSFINSDLVSSVTFSSGGFQPIYGDKMSSVLDVTYKKPKRKFGGSVELGLLGGSVHVEGIDKKERFTYLLGVRQKSSQYLLKSLDTKGEYSPSFTDVQGFLTFKVNDKIGLELIGNYARNRFKFFPVDRETTFGVVNEVLRLTMYFEGGELDTYETLMGGFAVNQKVSDRVGFKWLTSVYRSVETEAFDILGEYFLDEVESDFGSDNFGQTRYSLGVGGLHNYARNNLEAIVANLGHKGYFIKGDHNLKWGFTYQFENIEDRINEWERSDSAGYSLPYSGSEIFLADVLKTKINLQSNRINAYIQDSWRISDTNRVTFTYGARITYWDVNKEWVVSPRAQISYRPFFRRDVVFRAAAGLYNQPPFYRELRNLEGEINKNVKAQKSFHGVLGMDMNFTAWKRKFKFVTEVYYKYMWDLVPYEFDNVLIRYFGQNNSKGYATGIDLRLHGELVEGAESWISMSIMSTQEDVLDDSYIEYRDKDGNRIFTGTGQDDLITDTATVYPGMIPRPTDQRVRFSMFFQDYIPRVKWLRVHLNLIYATGLPFGPPDNKRYNDLLRIPAYRRVDIGFSAQLFDINRKKEIKQKNPFRHFDSIWATFEVFNLLGVNNTVSYLWVKDISNTTYAVPNYLTDRRFNLRLVFKF